MQKKEKVGVMPLAAIHLDLDGYAERSRLGCDDLSFYSRFLDLGL